MSDQIDYLSGTASVRWTDAGAEITVSDRQPEGRILLTENELYELLKIMDPE